MANTPDAVSCFSLEQGGRELLPLSPFYSLSYHFGMLLGVDDFETEQAYHRAKMRLHNAWLHREGVVWGFDVQPEVARGELKVLKGLALDAAGHELHLEGDACLDVAKWYEAHKGDADFKQEETEGGVRFDAHVCVRFKACLTRQVPAMSEPCDGAGASGTAYSRVFETVEILLRPGLAPKKRLPYPRLRALFGLGETADADVLPARAAVLALPADKRPAALLEHFRRFAARDEVELQPAQSADGERSLLFPGADDEPVVLANVAGIALEYRGERWALTGLVVDTSVRPSHVATATIQELLCGSLFDAHAPAGPEGPRVFPASLTLLTEKAVQFNVDKELLDASVQPAAFSVTWIDPEGDPNQGWRRAHIQAAAYGGAETRTVTLYLRSAVSGHVRLVVYGTGPAPLLGADFVPLAGAVGEPPATPHDGRDFVRMMRFTRKRAEEKSL